MMEEKNGRGGADLFRAARSQRSGSVWWLDAIQKVGAESPHQQFEWMNSLLLLDEALYLEASLPSL